MLKTFRSHRLCTTLYCASLLFFAAAAAQAQSPNKIPREVIDQTASQGRALVLVGLNMPWQMESRLSDDGVRAQRVAIAALQSDLLTQLEGRQYRIIRRYHEIPGLALEVGADALAELARLPLVTNVLLDRPAVKPPAPGDAALSQNNVNAAIEQASNLAKVPDHLYQHAATKGTVLVLAGLKTAWQREDLISDELLLLQRNGIHDAQSYLLAELTGTRYRVTRLYRKIPGIALRVGVDALRVLENSPAVTNVVEDRPPQTTR